MIDWISWIDIDVSRELKIDGAYTPPKQSTRRRRPPELVVKLCPICGARGIQGGNGMVMCTECTCSASEGDWQL